MANPEHVALVREGSAAVNTYAGEHPGTRLDLAGADLAGADLAGANLNDADLSGANLAGATLRNCGLGGCDLRGADLRGADVRGTPLHRSKLQNADLRGVVLDPIGVGRQLLCASAASFQDVRWDRERIEEFLQMLSTNKDWEVRWEIVPKC